MADSNKFDKQRKAFDFFTARLKDQREFNLQEVADYCGWKIATPKSYLTKKWKDLLTATGAKSFRVRREFNRITEEQFLGQASQNTPIYTDYSRNAHQYTVVFEFLLPLTREDKLRNALDELFYSDCLRQRIQEVGLDAMQKVLDRTPGLSDEEFLDELVERASVFGGYSIQHVQGRFRAGDMKSRKEAGGMLGAGERYLIDETTAVVKFIIPCSEGSTPFEESYGRQDSFHSPSDYCPDKLEDELRRVRGLFFYLFVEAVVRTVEGEAEIWLIESGVTTRLYRWSREGKET